MSNRHEVLGVAAFSRGATGGNPAGVVICDEMPPDAVMQETAARVGLSETAFAGYLRDLDWPHAGRIGIFQGGDMGIPSRITAEIGARPGAPIRVSGRARKMD